MEIKSLLEKANLKIPKENIKYNEPMKKHISFKVGGIADCYIKIENISELKQILKFSKENKIPFFIIGNGSNILVTDKGIRGIVIQIKINKFEIIKNPNNKNKQNEKNQDVQVIIGAGNKMAEIAQKLLKENITGFEELAGIPGTIGGAIKMNAGAYKKEIKDILESATVIDYEGNIIKLNNQDLKFEYRKSILFQKKYIVIEAELNLKTGKQDNIKTKMEEYKKNRFEKQPIEYPSAGSTFKRGENFITAKLIDEAGLKGYSIGDAQVSNKHAGFIINKGNATAQEILELIEYVKKKVYETSKEKISLEIEIVGER